MKKKKNRGGKKKTERKDQNNRSTYWNTLFLSNFKWAEQTLLIYVKCFSYPCFEKSRENVKNTTLDFWVFSSKDMLFLSMLIFYISNVIIIYNVLKTDLISCNTQLMKFNNK